MIVLDSTAGITAPAATISGALSAATSTAASGFASGTGAGGSVTQLTSRTTGVTLNTPTGAVTLFSAAGSATWAAFTVTNSSVGANDVVVVSVKTGATNVYLTDVTGVAAGSFVINFATTSGTATDAPVFQYAVIKGAVS